MPYALNGNPPACRTGFRIVQGLCSDFRFAVSDNISLIYICVAYYFSTYILGHLLGEPITGNLGFYYLIFFGYLIAFIFLIWSASTVIYLARHRKQGLDGIPIIWGQLRQQYLTSRTITRFAVIFSLLPIFSCSYSSIKQAIPLFNGFSFDFSLYQFDKALHFGHSPWELLQPILGYPLITRFFDFCYLAWVSIFAYTLLYMACHPDRRSRLRFLLSLALCWIVIGNVLATMLPSAGPCYFLEATPSGVDPYGPLFTYLRHIPGLKAVGIQDSLWGAYKAGIFMPMGGISAMPSMHVSVAVLLALLFRGFGRWQGWMMMIFAGIIQLGSVHLGWHYAVDGYVSACLTVGIWMGVGRCLKKEQAETAELLRG